MNDLQFGQYRIMPAGNSSPPPFPVGANLSGPPVAPVVSAGRDNVWLIRRNESGNFALLLKTGGGSWLSQPGGDDVIVGIMPGPGEWAIQKQGGQDGDVYSIEVPSDRWPTRAWTLRDTAPGTKVELCVYELPRPGQLWRFIPVRDE